MEKEKRIEIPVHGLEPSPATTESDGKPSAPEQHTDQTSSKQQSRSHVPSSSRGSSRAPRSTSLAHMNVYGLAAPSQPSDHRHYRQSQNQSSSQSRPPRTHTQAQHQQHQHQQHYSMHAQQSQYADQAPRHQSDQAQSGHARPARSLRTHFTQPSQRLQQQVALSSARPFPTPSLYYDSHHDHELAQRHEDEQRSAYRFPPQQPSQSQQDHVISHVAQSPVPARYGGMVGHERQPSAPPYQRYHEPRYDSQRAPYSAQAQPAYYEHGLAHHRQQSMMQSPPPRTRIAERQSGYAPSPYQHPTDHSDPYHGLQEERTTRPQYADRAPSSQPIIVYPEMMQRSQHAHHMMQQPLHAAATQASASGASIPLSASPVRSATRTSFAVMSPASTSGTRDEDQVQTPQSKRKTKKMRAADTEAIVEWLHQNYELKDGVSIPRCSLYEHYSDDCSQADKTPINPASFGKIIRQQFPELKTRRLGTRGQSKYHYYGVRLKPSSTYRRPRQDTRTDSSPSVSKQTSPRRLPSFPRVDPNLLPADMNTSETDVLLLKLKTHYEHVLELAIGRKFDELEPIVTTFWTALPPDLLHVACIPAVADVICVCDNILHTSILSEVISNVLEPLAMEVIRALRMLARNWMRWLESSSSRLDPAMVAKRTSTAYIFTKALERQTSLNHVAQAAQTVFTTPSITAQMRDDWQHLDFQGITIQLRNVISRNVCRTINKARASFDQMLARHTPLERYIHWFARLLETCVATRNGPIFQKRAKKFILLFNIYTSMITRDLRRRNAASFSSFHLVKMLLDEYFTFLVERRLASDHATELRVRVGLEDLRPFLPAHEAQRSLLDDIHASDDARSSGSRGGVTHGGRKISQQQQHDHDHDQHDRHASHPARAQEHSQYADEIHLPPPVDFFGEEFQMDPSLTLAGLGFQGDLLTDPMLFPYSSEHDEGRGTATTRAPAHEATKSHVLPEMPDDLFSLEHLEHAHDLIYGSTSRS